MSFEISLEEINKLGKFVKYAQIEANPPENFINNKWDELYTIIIRLLLFAESESGQSYQKIKKIAKKDMYKFIHENSEIFAELVEMYKTHWKNNRKAYLFRLRIGEMTGSEFAEFMALTGR